MKLAYRKRGSLGLLVAGLLAASCGAQAMHVRDGQIFLNWASNTNNATQNTVDTYFGWVEAGTTIMISTCANQGGFNGDTWFRLRDNITLQELWENNDAQSDNPDITNCGVGSSITYTVTKNRPITWAAGCDGSDSCSWGVKLRIDRNANGNLINSINEINSIAAELPETRPYKECHAFFDGNINLPYNDWWDDDHWQGVVRVPDWLQSAPDQRFGNTNLMATFSNDGGGYLTRFGHEWADDTTPWNMDPIPPGLGQRRVISESNPSYNFNHPGGMQRSGRYLLMGAENIGGNPSAGEVAVFDLKDNRTSWPPQRWRFKHNLSTVGQVAVTHLQGVTKGQTKAKWEGWSGAFLIGINTSGEAFFLLVERGQDGWADLACAYNPTSFGLLAGWKAEGFSMVTHEDGSVFLHIMYRSSKSGRGYIQTQEFLKGGICSEYNGYCCPADRTHCVSFVNSAGPFSGCGDEFLGGSSIYFEPPAMLSIYDLHTENFDLGTSGIRGVYVQQWGRDNNDLY